MWKRRYPDMWTSSWNIYLEKTVMVEVWLFLMLQGMGLEKKPIHTGNTFLREQKAAIKRWTGMIAICERGPGKWVWSPATVVLTLLYICFQMKRKWGKNTEPWSFKSFFFFNWFCRVKSLVKKEKNVSPPDYPHAFWMVDVGDLLVSFSSKTAGTVLYDKELISTW